MSNGKQKEILGRIREALRIAAPLPPGTGPQPPSVSLQTRAWLPAVPPNEAGKLAMFQKNCQQLRTEFCLAEGTEGARKTLRDLCQKYGWNLAAAHHSGVLDQIVQSLEIEILYVEDSRPAETLEKCSVGITACDALIAQTGSILLTARSAGGRALSVLPPHHVVIALADQLLPDLPAAFELLSKSYQNSYPSFATFITGPSRTGDIERILVLGAHGPRNLSIVLVQ